MVREFHFLLIAFAVLLLGSVHFRGIPFEAAPMTCCGQHANSTEGMLAACPCVRMLGTDTAPYTIHFGIAVLQLLFLFVLFLFLLPEAFFVRLASVERIEWKMTDFMPNSVYVSIRTTSIHEKKNPYRRNLCRPEKIGLKN